ncbi:Ribonuclease CAF1 protein [Dioscorea alata]|uniref:Ribonuclease CAF1 protein n=1 Tax=Dioscorea alata TaxID=55571 RepID=A0ACB7WMA9_DIOAL|nr:Ribonuclease CAF1 protein [Dioscorea alata]
MRKQWLLCVLPKTLTLARRSHPFSSSSSGGGVAVKKVTKANFESTLEDLRTRVREADFVAIDLEMTGVTSAPWRECFEFDRSDVRYLKVKDSAEKFAVVQFGVCPFRWDSSRGSFLAYPHNFFVFPRKELPLDGPAYEFLCQTTSMNFLAKYQFDFNACIHEGISYLSRAQEAEALSKLSSAYENELTNSTNTSQENLEIPIVSTADLLFTERIKNRFHEWRNGIMKNSCTDHYLKEEPGCVMSQFQTVFFKMRPAVELNGFNSHQMKLIQLVLRKHFEDLVFIRTPGEEVVFEKKVVYTDSEEDKALLMREVLEDLHRSKEARVRSAVGLRHVIDCLVSEQKLIVGHNCFLDIAHVYSKFFGPLPSSIMEFALSVHENFPNIVDTKHLLNSSHALQYLMKKSSKSLSSAFSLLCPEISSYPMKSAHASYVKFEVQADEAGSSNWTSGAKHEAGFDAFMTGCLFAQECAHLGIKFDLSSPLTNLATNEKLKGYINLLYPSWNSGTVIDLTTGIEKPESNYKRKYPTVLFSNIVLLWGFPSKFKPKDLKDCISKVFGASSVTSIFFLDYTAALVQFSKKEFVNDFLMLKDTLERNPDDPISVLNPLAGLLEGDNTRAADYDTYKTICSSSASKVLFADQAEAAGIRWKTLFSSHSPEAGSSAETRLHSHHVSCEDIIDTLYAARSVS